MKIFVISLGCPKNRTDTEQILGAFHEFLPECTITGDYKEADILLVNTCAFIEEAVEESIETILELANSRKEGQFLAVMGCLYKRYGQELAKALPEVDIFFGHELTGDVINKILGHAGLLDKMCPLPLSSSAGTRLITTPPWRAYLKVLEGCSRRCTYCLIPRIRGGNRPRPLSRILSELKSLEEKGIKEVTLVGQDLSSWSLDGQGLVGLVLAMKNEINIPWLRLMYLHPLGISRRLLDVMAMTPNICNYLDIPIQHASTRILKRMGRGYGLDHIKRLFGLIKESYPEFAIRTTVMVGFPGETDDDFGVLVDFIQEFELDHVGCFIYSDEEEAPSHRLDQKVPRAISEERRDAILSVQKEISRKRLKRWVGQTATVLVEGFSKETDLLLEGRADFQAPEVDGLVYINEGEASPGEFYQVEITEAHDYDLVGRIIRPLAGPTWQSVQSFGRRWPLPLC